MSLFFNLGELERKRWLDLLEKWSTVLSMNKYDVGKTDIDYKIRLSETNPSKSFYTPLFTRREASNFKGVGKNERGKFY